MSIAFYQRIVGSKASRNNLAAGHGGLERVVDDSVLTQHAGANGVLEFRVSTKATVDVTGLHQNWCPNVGPKDVLNIGRTYSPQANREVSTRWLK